MKFRPEFITRHSDLINPDAYNRQITIIGAGAIGSFVTLALAKMGYRNITVYDFDTVESENISAQFYPTSAIGIEKVVALKEMVMQFSGIEIFTKPIKVTPEMSINADIVISAVDSMEVRKMLFEISNCYWFIDPRMGAEYSSMEVVDFQNQKSRTNYKATLYSDASAVQERCTAKTTIYTVLLIAGQVVKAVKDITSSKIDSRLITSLDWNIRDNAMLAFSNGRKL